MTWGEYAAALEPLIDEIESLVPPPELTAYRAAGLQAAKAIKDSIGEQKQDEAANPFALTGALLAAGSLLVSAEENLPPELRQRLADNDCETGSLDGPAPEPTAGGGRAVVGDTIILSGFDKGVAVTLVEVVDAAKPKDEFTEPEPGNRLVAFRLRLENVSDMVYDDFSSSGAVVVDTQDQGYDASVFNAVEPSLGSVTIAPGDRRAGFPALRVRLGGRRVGFAVRLQHQAASALTGRTTPRA